MLLNCVEYAACVIEAEESYVQDIHEQCDKICLFTYTFIS